MALVDLVVWAHRRHPLQDLCEQSILDTLEHSQVHYKFHLMINPAGCHINMNRGYRTGDSRYVILLDEDVQFLTKDWLAPMIEVMEKDPKIGVLNTAEVKDPAGVEAYMLQTEGDYRKGRLEIHPWVPAYVMLFDRERTPWLEFDEDLPGRKGMTDVDACLQINAHGLVCLRDNGIMVYHPHKGNEEQRRADNTTTKEEELACFHAQLNYMTKKWGKIYWNAVQTTSIRYELKDQATRVPEWWKP